MNVKNYKTFFLMFLRLSTYHHQNGRLRVHLLEPISLPEIFELIVSLFLLCYFTCYFFTICFLRLAKNIALMLNGILILIL